MKTDKKFQWYNLPEEVRNKLINISTGFHTLKDQGMWIHPIYGYEPEVIAVLRTHNTYTLCSEQHNEGLVCIKCREELDGEINDCKRG